MQGKKVKKKETKHTHACVPEVQRKKNQKKKEMETHAHVPEVQRKKNLKKTKTCAHVLEVQRKEKKETVIRNKRKYKNKMDGLPLGDADLGGFWW